MIYKKICEFCSECKPSSREIKLIDVFICCSICLPKIYKQDCILCGGNTHMYGTGKVCIHCKRQSNDISLETPIR